MIPLPFNSGLPEQPTAAEAEAAFMACDTDAYVIVLNRTFEELWHALEKAGHKDRCCSDQRKGTRRCYWINMRGIKLMPDSYETLFQGEDELANGVHTSLVAVLHTQAI